MNTPKNINRLTLRHFWHTALQERKRLILVLIFIPLNTLCLSTLVPLYIGKILAGLGQQTPVGGHLALVIVFAALGVVANYIGFTAFMTFQALGMQRLETEALDTLLKRSVGFHNNSIAGKLVAEAGYFPTAFSNLSGTVLLTIMQILVALLTGIGVVFANSVLLGALVVIMTIAVFGVSLWQTARNSPYRRERHAARRTMVAHQADVITNSVTIKTFARETSEIAESKRLSSQLAAFRIRDWSRDGRNGTLRIACMLAFEIVYVLLAVKLVHDNPALLAIGIFTFSYVINLTNRLFDIGSIFRTIEDSLLEAGDIMTVIATEPEIVDTPHARALKVQKGGIRFEDVAFRYADAAEDAHVFEHLNLTVKPGEKIGLVGHSGGGKSTLTRLLLRFDDITGGDILIDGQKITDVTQASLRNNIAYVPQEPLLFHRSIRENIAYGNPGASLKQVREAARKSYAADFIESLPEAYDTIVGERGVKLSGGQRQRIAIARALLKDAPILLLDEATSALDSESEVLIQQALWKLMENRTALVIAHRLSTIQKMDRIIVLDNGKIVEDGSHKELLAKKDGTYARLWAHQSGGFMEE